MIKTVLIDVDNTLLDFNKSACLATKKAMAYYNLPFREEDFSKFIEINDGLWRDIEKGKLTREQLKAKRFNLILSAWGIDFDGVKVEEKFRQYLKDCAVTVDGAIELLEYLTYKYDVYVVSNAIHAMQQNRLKVSGIHKYFKDFFVSELIGADKPSKEFFDRCFNRLKTSREETILIGDSLSADILGGINSNIKTIWFDYNNTGDTKGLKPDYIVTKLVDVKDIL